MKRKATFPKLVRYPNQLHIATKISHRAMMLLQKRWKVMKKLKVSHCSIRSMHHFREVIQIAQVPWSSSPPNAPEENEEQNRIYMPFYKTSLLTHDQMLKKNHKKRLETLKHLQFYCMNLGSKNTYCIF